MASIITSPAATGVLDEDTFAKDTIVFEGTEVRAYHSGSRWHVLAAGHEAISANLDEALQILFNPRFHANTQELVHEIHEKVPGPRSGISWRP
jgi:hypothetical protein